MILDRLKTIAASAVLLVAMCLPLPLALKLQEVANRLRASETP